MHLIKHKKYAYIWQTLLGCLLLVLAYFLSRDSGGDPDPTRTIAAWVMLFPGLACLLFGLSAYMLREEPDIWM